MSEQQNVLAKRSNIPLQLMCVIRIIVQRCSSDAPISVQMNMRLCMRINYSASPVKMGITLQQAQQKKKIELIHVLSHEIHVIFYCI